MGERAVTRKVYKINRNNPRRICVTGSELRHFFGWTTDELYRKWHLAKVFPVPMNRPEYGLEGLSFSEARRRYIDFRRSQSKHAVRSYYWDGRAVAAMLRRQNGDTMANVFLDQLWVQSDLDKDYIAMVAAHEKGQVYDGKPVPEDERPDMPPPPPIPPVKGAAV